MPNTCGQTDGEWGDHGPNQAIDCAADKEEESQRLFRKTGATSVTRRGGRVQAINQIAFDTFAIHTRGKKERP